MTRNEDGTYIVNTSTLCDKKGFRGTTPVEVYIKDGKVVKVVALRNNESATYFNKVKKFLLPLFEGVKIKEAKDTATRAHIDGCTGATYSTKAVQQNVAAALDYYESHK